MAALKLISTLALATLAVGQQTQMATGSFNITAYNDLMNCVKDAFTRYDVAIDNGAVVIIPPQGEAIDLDSDADNALRNCLDNFSPYLHLAVDDSRNCLEREETVATTQALATAEWAETNGALGITRENRTVPNFALDTSGSPALLPRQVAASYFYSFGSEHDDCSDYDQQINVLNECINFRSAYRSIRFGNPSRYNALRVRRWPHHLCAVNYSPPGKDGRTVTVPINDVSVCYNHPDATFSFLARLVPNSCVGTCA